MDSLAEEPRKQLADQAQAEDTAGHIQAAQVVEQHMHLWYKHQEEAPCKQPEAEAQAESRSQ